MVASERMRGAPLAMADGFWASDLVEVSGDPRCLEGTGRWIVVLPYTGTPTFLRFARWDRRPPDGSIGSFRGPRRVDWRSSCTRAEYVRAVEHAREAIAAGAVYQVNVCRLLQAPAPDVSQADVAALGLMLAAGNPAPHAAIVRVPELGISVASASPELFLHRAGERVTSGPIKGTAPTAATMLDKDRSEDVMIVDLMRNDLARVCVPGTVRVPRLLEVQEHPGLVHLVSTVSGTLAAENGWPELLEASFPPGSVTGAPKIAARRLIGELESVPRGMYCGALGWVDADSCAGSLGVAIRTFWTHEGVLNFGTGAGITWGSDAEGEWQETELKASRLLDVAAGSYGSTP